MSFSSAVQGDGRWIKGLINGCWCGVGVCSCDQCASCILCRHTGRFIPPSSRCRHRSIPSSVSCHDAPWASLSQVANCTGPRKEEFLQLKSSDLIYQSRSLSIVV